MAHLQLGEREEKKRGEREKRRSGTEAGKVRERTPAGAWRGREAVTSCSSGCSAKESPRQPPVPGSEIWLVSAPAPRGCSSPRRCFKASPGRMDPGMWVQDRAAPPFPWENAARAEPNPSSHPAASMGGVLHSPPVEIPPRSHPCPSSSCRDSRYTFGVLRDELPI